MNSFKLLDCTLRDGGYINNWEFGYDVICNIVKKLVESEVDYIELGFLRNCDYDKNATLFNNVNEARAILPENKIKSKYTLMALHNLYDVNKLEYNDGTIDSIRVTFHDYDIDEGLVFVQKVMDKGYNVFCNPINVMGYSDNAILKMIEKVNKISPFAFSIVDTFGSMMKNDLLRIYSLFEHNLDKSIQIGLHLHENLGLSYSLAQNFIDICSHERNVVIDGSLFGMGRVPGNLSIELMMDYMNRYLGGHYNPNAAYDAIDDYIERLKEIEQWGYSTAYALSAKYNLHRNYSEYLLGKGKLRAKDVNQILAGVVETKKSTYDEAYIEELYVKYQNNVIDDSQSKKELSKLIENRNILILAPGYSLKTHKREIEGYILKNDSLVISANHNDQIFGSILNFYSSIRRFDQYVTKDINKQILISSNVRLANDSRYMLFNYYDLACDENGIFDDCVIMLLRLLVSIGITDVTLAGFDGFTSSSPNYAYDDHLSEKKVALEQNKVMSEYIVKLRRKINLNFITPSYYNK